MSINKKCKICVIGSANADIFLYVPHIPQVGQTIQCSNVQFKNGGKGANQAVAASKLSAHTIFCGQVGNDSLMQKLKNQLQQNNVHLYWKQLKDVTTGQAFIFIDENGQNSITIIGGANNHYNEMVLSEQMKKGIIQSDFLMLQCQIPQQINILASKLAKQKGKKVILDCGGKDQLFPDQLLNNLDYISPNQTQLQRLIKFEVPLQPEHVRPFLQKYPNLKLLVKQSSSGCTYFSKQVPNGLTHPAVNKLNSKIDDDYKIIDTVGAGDCFTSGFVIGIQQGKGLLQSMLFANAAAFLCITCKGAMSSMPTRSQLQDFMKNYI